MQERQSLLDGPLQVRQEESHLLQRALLRKKPAVQELHSLEEVQVMQGERQAVQMLIPRDPSRKEVLVGQAMQFCGWETHPRHSGWHCRHHPFSTNAL
jgi:hypothetical protein